MALRRIQDILPSVLGEIRWVRRNGRVNIDTCDESREVLLGLIASAVESGLMTSAADIESVRVNGRVVSRSSLL